MAFSNGRPLLRHRQLLSGCFQLMFSGGRPLLGCVAGRHCRVPGADLLFQLSLSGAKPSLSGGVLDGARLHHRCQLLCSLAEIALGPVALLLCALQSDGELVSARRGGG
ncbi:hypothetical protein FJT64_008815 [Amphibalanus amphitrite]|uniref:Uncharacterized protein n=1 Tax=Amphibalanus amphitrite TaxID=1232801 RepID=A0A6A4VAH4_AMPAM|nr:hypothetical protein FJT64_008815 [Amphibalanus amphitrite]